MDTVLFFKKALRRLIHPALEKVLPLIDLDVRHARSFKNNRPLPATSFFGEGEIIKSLLSKLPNQNRCCVDIGASDGVTMSNTFSLFTSGWSGLAIEASGAAFANLSYELENFSEVKLYKNKVYPENIISILDSAEIPLDFDFLSLDIDGYDYFVLSSILQKYRPKLICTEINEKIPPPIRFTVLPNRSYFWAGDLFFGQSLSQVGKLCERVNYQVVQIEYNNAFLMPSEITSKNSDSLEDIYRKGYLNKVDRLSRLPWNKEFEPIYKMGIEDAVTFINEKYKKYEGKYLIEY